MHIKWTQRSAVAHLGISLQDTLPSPSPQKAQTQLGISLFTPKIISSYHFSLFVVQGASIEEWLH